MREHSLGASSNLTPSLPQAQVDRMVAVATPSSLGRGDALYIQGEPADRIYLLLAGRAKASSVNAEGQETVLRVHIPGSLLGLTALSTTPSRDATATALDDCRLAWLSRERMFDLMREDPELGIHITQLLLERISTFQFRVHEVLTNTVEQRVARALLGFSMVPRQGGKSAASQPQLLLSHEELSQIVAARRPTVTQVLRHFADAGLVRIERRCIVILDGDGLAQFVPG